MIGLLSGTLLEVQAPNLLLDVNGVGYEVEVSATVLAKAPMVGERMTLATHFVVREDAQLLFGFDTKQERDLFRGFIKISGVGPKLALALISALFGSCDSGSRSTSYRQRVARTSALS